MLAPLAEEIRNPRRVIPIDVLSSIAVVAALYLVSTTLFDGHSVLASREP